MARLASQEKMGYYKTPPIVVEHIKSGLDISPQARLFDPCCGTGEALRILASGESEVETYGIELEKSRYAEAIENLGYVLHADALTEVKFSSQLADLLFLNPPYDEGYRGQRMEKEFLLELYRSMALKGLLVFIIPHKVLWVVKDHMAIYYDNFEFYRFPDGEFEKFGQIVVIARKKRTTKQRSAENLGRLDEIANLSRWGEIEKLPTTERFTDEFNKRRLTVFAKSKSDSIFSAVHVDPDELQPLTRTHKGDFFRKVVIPDFQSITPLLPLKKGHLAMLLAAGYINGELRKGDFDLVIKGSVVASEEEVLDTDDDTTIIRKKPSITVNVLNMADGTIKALS